MDDEIFLVKLSPDDARKLELLAQLQRCDRNQALKNAISTEAYMIAEAKRSSKIKVYKTDGTVEQVVFKCVKEGDRT